MRSKVLILICLSLSFLIQAQEDRSIIDYTQKNTYNIGGVEVVGAETRDRNAIKSITGLRIGKEIKIPGDDIPGARERLFGCRSENF